MHGLEHEAITLFTTGVRMTVLVFLIIVLGSSIRKTKAGESKVSEVARNPRVLLVAVCTLLTFSLLELLLESLDHWVIK